MSSLQDQLLKAGLANAKQAKQATKAKKKQAKDMRKGLSTGSDAEQRAALAKQVQAERSKQLNNEREAQKLQKERVAQAKQIILRCRLDISAGEFAYNFVDEKKVKRLYVNEGQQQWLSKGSLVIVGLENQYHVVPAAIGEKLAQRTDQVSIIKAVVDAQDTPAEDDPYADYVIPDDLMW